MPEATEGKRVGPFIKSEVKGFLASLWKGFWVTTAVVAFCMTLYLLYSLWIHPTPSPAGVAPQPPINPLLELLVVIGFSIVYSSPVGAVGGLFKVAWRLFGRWTLLPILLTPLLIYFMFWVSSDFLLQEGRDILDALRISAAVHGLSATNSILEGGRIGHAGAPALIILMIPLVLGLIVDSLRILFDVGFLWQLFQFLFYIGLFFLLGCLASVILSSPPLVISLIRRIKARYREFMVKVS